MQKSMPSSQAVAGGGRVRHDARWLPDEVVQTEQRIDSPGHTLTSLCITHLTTTHLTSSGWLNFFADFFLYFKKKFGKQLSQELYT